MLETDFETATAGAPLPGWVGLGGNWVGANDEGGVLQQSQASFRGFAQATRLWTDYDVAATVRPLSGSGQWAVGLVAYWTTDGGCYRLSNFGNVLAIWRESSVGVEALAATHLELRPQQAYRMRLSVRNEKTGTTLRGKVWAAGEPEPDKWLLSAQDVLTPLRSGRAGFFTGRATAAFSDLTLTGANDQILVQDPLVGESAGRQWHWELVGGEWQGVTSVQPFRQVLTGDSVAFSGAAYALLSGWENYTVRVMARAAPGSRNQGFGVAAYWQSDTDSYVLGQTGGSALILARRSSAEGQVPLATVPFALRRGTWYNIELRVENLPESVRLQGKVWPARAGEPLQWQIQAEERGTSALRGGEVGLWAIDDVCSFDDLLVRGNN